MRVYRGEVRREGRKVFTGGKLRIKRDRRKGRRTTSRASQNKGKTNLKRQRGRSLEAPSGTASLNSVWGDERRSKMNLSGGEGNPGGFRSAVYLT